MNREDIYSQLGVCPAVLHFGEQVLEYAPDLSEIGYTLVSENLKPLTLSATEELNVIKFVYEENTGAACGWFL